MGGGPNYKNSALAHLLKETLMLAEDHIVKDRIVNFYEHLKRPDGVAVIPVGVLGP